MGFKSKDRQKNILKYYKTIKTANKEAVKKEIFKDLLNRLYGDDNEIREIIDKISEGAERTILNIPRKDKIHRGSADTLYNNIIIEFENNLKITLNHAKVQLAGYLLGQIRSGNTYNYTLIASDFISWKVYAPDIEQIQNLETLTEDQLELKEIESASFVLNEDNTEDFFYWIDRFLFKEQKQKATLKRIEESFGYQGNVFIESYREMSKHFDEVEGITEVQVCFEQWSKFLSIAYGTYDASKRNFLVHTYLSIFSKMLAYAVVSNDDYVDEFEVKEILNGHIFNKYNIQNFVDNDFFHWINNEKAYRDLKSVYRLIAQEISTYDFNQVSEDVLKGVYQELIDLDTRHHLGEYYTPDWLCERVVNEFEFKHTDKILDPACGSGSFLRAAIHRIRSSNNDISAEDINRNIWGIDIHPLSVQIAKTTVLLALGKGIIKAKKPVHINIILANTILAPEGVKNLFGGEFIMQIDKEKLWLNTQVFEDVQMFDEALEVCEDLAEHSLNKKKENLTTFENNLKRRYRDGGWNDTIIRSFYKIYESFKSVKESGRDSIWKFIVQNLYKPYFLNKKFDYIIGNPPWFTYSDVKNEEYQDLLNTIAERYNIKPERAANFPHLEVAAIFLSHCSSYFLNENGKIGFVLPRSFFSADHHDNTRSGKAKGYRISEIWDLSGINPLFRIPSSVIFGQKNNVPKPFPISGVGGKIFKGSLPDHNCNLDSAKGNITEDDVKWYYIKHGKSTAFSTNKTSSINQPSPYKRLFRQGATIVPRVFYFIEYNHGSPPDWDTERMIAIKTDKAILPDSKSPWKEYELVGSIEGNFFFLTALASNILPFGLLEPKHIILPITIKTNKHQNKEIVLHTSDSLLEDGYSGAAKWFKKTESIWIKHRTEKNKKFDSFNYLNWQNKLIDQNLNAPFLVIYNSSAKDANAVVIARKDFFLEFIVESSAYVLYCKDISEAYYLSAFLNSRIPNLLMKDFQAKGSFGARHVHKKILDTPFPKFDKKQEAHIQLAKLGQDAHEKVKSYLIKINSENRTIKGINLGNTRLQIKRFLEVDLNNIDKLVKVIMKSN